MENFISRKGYHILKKNISKKVLDEIKKDLLFKPVAQGSQPVAKDQEVKHFVEDQNYLIVPKRLGINRFGDCPLKNMKINKVSIPFIGEIREEQKETYNALVEHLGSKGSGILQSSTGSGKCHGIDTPLLMFDGSVKMVQDIKEGEFLMGDDSTPRKVLSLARGKDEMYKIVPLKGESYIVNKEHILCLKVSGKPTITKNKNKNFFSVRWFEDLKHNVRTFKSEEEANIFFKTINGEGIVEISVSEYLKLKRNIKCILKGYKVPIDFKEQKIAIDPYLIGFLLGKGDPKITTCEWEHLNKKMPEYLTYPSTSDFMTLHNLNLIKNNQIPDIYKINSKKNRLKLLAGFLDADSSLDNNVFYISKKSEKLIDDIVYLARSLGFSCYKTKEENYYYRISIRGSEEEISTLTTRKKEGKRKRIKDVLRTGIKVESIGKGDYYGFVIDKNHRYVLGDFTVTHNTFLSLKAISHLGYKTLIISASVNQVDLLKQWEEQINIFLPKARVGLLRGPIADTQNKDIILSTISSLSRKEYSNSIFSGIGLVIIDECHHISSKTHSKVLFKIGGSPHLLGLSATPNRQDNLSRVLEQWTGPPFYSYSKLRLSLPPKVITYKLTSSLYKEFFTSSFGQEKIAFTTMISQLVQIEERNKLIIKTVIDLIKKEPSRCILVVSERINHINLLNDLLSQEKDLQATYSMYIGTKMKTEQKKESLKSQIILATSQSFGEGIDKPDLNTLILTTPKKYTAENKSKKTFASISFVQIIGRIFRKEHHVLCPLIIDFWDQFSVYKNQGYSRRSYYTKQLQECEITTININLGEKEKAGSCAPKKEKAGSCVSQKEEDSPLLLDTLILD